MLVLASRSPRRAELLRAAGIRFRIVPPPEEEAVPDSACREYRRLVIQAALAKARSVASHTRGLEAISRLRQEGRNGATASPHRILKWPVVLGADTIVTCEGLVLGKPSDLAEAGRILELLSGRWHTVHTGVALVCGDRHKVGHQRTRVAFRELSKEDISRYLASGEPMDKAGAYAIQGAGAAFVREIRGCYTNVVGLPIPLVLRMLEEFELSGMGTDGRTQQREIR